MLADFLSNDKKKFTYDKRKKSDVAQAVIDNVKQDEIIKTLLDLRTKEDYFPKVLQVDKILFGPLGFLTSSHKRTRSDSYSFLNIFEKYFSEKDVELIAITLQNKIPIINVQSIINSKQDVKSKLLQLILCYATNEETRLIINTLLSKKEVSQITLLQLTIYDAHFTIFIIIK